jgi:hypothetical protein
MQAIEVENHVANTKYCLARILADRGREPVYKKVTQAKSMKDLCEALQVEYTEKLGDAPSRGAQSAVAKAADRLNHLNLFLMVAKQSQRVEVKMNNVHVVEDSPSKDFVIQTEGTNRNALTA